ncbi:MAG: CoA transferase, partial [Thermocrispum sp.]
PAKSGIPAADIGAGMYAFSAILSALYDRERTGSGVALDISLFDAMIEWMGYPLYYAGYSGSRPARSGMSHAAIAPYGAFTVGDGTEFVISVQNHREWVLFCERVLRRPHMLEDDRFATGSRRVENRTALDNEIEGVFSRLTGIQLEQRLTAAGIAHARRRELDEVLNHPQLAARDRFTKVGSPAGALNAVLPVITYPHRPPRLGPVPAIGQQTDDILTELGFTAVERAGWRADGVI